MSDTGPEVRNAGVTKNFPIVPKGTISQVVNANLCVSSAFVLNHVRRPNYVFSHPRPLKIAAHLLTIALFIALADHSAYSQAVPQVTGAVDSRSFRH